MARGNQNGPGADDLAVLKFLGKADFPTSNPIVARELTFLGSTMNDLYQVRFMIRDGLDIEVLPDVEYASAEAAWTMTLLVRA